MSKLKWRKLKPPDFSPACWKIARSLKDFKWPEANMESLKRAVWERSLVDQGVTMAALRKCVGFLWATNYRKRSEYRPMVCRAGIVENAGVSHDAGVWVEAELKATRRCQNYMHYSPELSSRYYKVRDRHLDTALRNIPLDRCYFNHDLVVEEESSVVYIKPEKRKQHRWRITVRTGFLGRVKAFCAQHGIRLEGSGIIDVRCADNPVLRVRRGRGYSCIAEWISIEEIKREQRKRQQDSRSPF